MVASHNEPHILTQLTFLPGRGVDEICAVLARHDLGFTPSRVEVTVGRDETFVPPTDVAVDGGETLVLPFDAHVWHKIASVRDRDGIRLETKPTGPSIHLHAGVTDTSVHASGCRLDDALLDDLLRLPGLLGGVRGDATDARWQGETEPQMYRLFYDGPWEHLPRTVDEWGEEVIDVSANPGRADHVPGMVLWAAQDLWFGPASSIVIAYDAVRTLPVGVVTDRGEGLLQVRLWENGTPVDEVRRIQRILRDHLDYDGAMRRVDTIRAALLDVRS